MAGQLGEMQQEMAEMQMLNSASMSFRIARTRWPARTAMARVAKCAAGTGAIASPIEEANGARRGTSGKRAQYEVV